MDNLMLAIKKDAIDKDQRLSHEYFVSKANEFVNADIQSFFEKHIVNGELFDLAGFFETFGYEFNPTTTIYDLGFRMTEDRKSVVEIDTASNAYLAGIRKGDQIVKR